ncbi:MAG TPA: HlyD family secretion protein [Fimbriimonadaceae bacterium]|nr:HlyD family secretion protein [Fimbriimonadaceae bacterium]
MIVLVCVVVVGGFFGIRMFQYNSTHVTTDDAYVTMDVVPINPLINGNITSVPVSENQEVRPGQLLVQLDDTTFKADLAQAEANLAVAEANARSAEADLGLTQQTGSAQVSEAQGGVQVGGTDIATANSNVDKAISGVQTAEATLRSSDAQAKAADEAVQAQIISRARVAQQLTGSQAAVTNAAAAVKVAQANLANAQATYTNADRDARRYRTLADQGAVPVSTAEQRETAAANAKAAVDAAAEQVKAAQAAEAQRRSDYSVARQQVKEADSAIVSARANAKAAHQAALAQAARVTQAGADLQAARQGVTAAQARQQQNVGKLTEAQALPKRISMSQAAKAQAIAKVAQARAALTSAQVALARTKIVAPVGGRISKKTAEVGQQVTPGQPLMSLIPSEIPWIVANFKETQMADIRQGEEVEIEVDAVPGRTFKGHVNSISAGTGSTFALLPADNATGNFTKVVQRVAVKITLDPGQPDLEKLAAGLSANVAVIVK